MRLPKFKKFSLKLKDLSMSKFREMMTGLNNWTTVSLAVLLIGLINFLLTLFPLRWDLTSNQRFSLSSASKDLVSEIDDLVTVKVFVSSKLPEQLSPVVQQVKDLLWEYEVAGGSKFSVEYFDPSENTEVAEEAYSLGIYPMQFNDYSQDSLQVSQGYFGLAIFYADQQEVISFVEDTSNLEYQISLALNSLTREIIPLIGFVSGHEEKDLSEDLTVWGSYLAELYEVSPVSLTEMSLDDLSDYAGLVIVDPQAEFSDEEQEKLDGFLSQGKGVLVLAEGVNVAEGLLAEVSSHNLNDWLDQYGLKLEQSLVLDAVNELASFSYGNSVFAVPYPFWPITTAEGMSSDSVITYGLEGSLFAWVSPVNILSETSDSVSFQVLIQSSDRSWTDDDLNLDPTQQFSLPQAVSAQNLAVLREEKLSSDKSFSRLIVCGDSSLAIDRFTQGVPANLSLLGNMVDYLASETGLSLIRAKGDLYRPLKELTSSQKQQVRYANVLIPSVLFISFGFWRYLRRERS